MQSDSQLFRDDRIDCHGFLDWAMGAICLQRCSTTSQQDSVHLCQSMCSACRLLSIFLHHVKTLMRCGLQSGPCAASSSSTHVKVQGWQQTCPLVSPHRIPG